MKTLKKLLSALLVAVMLMSAAPLSGIADFDWGSLFATKAAALATEGYYTYTVSDGKATIYDVDTSISGDIVIPSTLGGYPVTKITYRAFYYCTGLTSVIIPDSVISIGSDAFRGCTSLTSVNYTGTRADWCKIKFDGNNSNPVYYSKCLYINGEDVGDVVVPNDVTEISEYAFYNCNNLTSITIPDSVTSIGKKSFYGCSGLTSVTIGNGVTSIGGESFSGCSGLTSITIPNSVTSIGYDAFYGCSGLTSVNYTGTREDWCRIKFEIDGWNTGSSNPVKYSKCLYINGEDVGNVVVPDDVTGISSHAFYNCANLTSITIPDSVTSIGKKSFYGCSGLTSVTIGNGVTSIGGESFSGCSGLTSITIPNSVTSIGYDAFYGCSGLTSVNYTGTREDWCRIKFEIDGWNTGSSNPVKYSKCLYINGEDVGNVVVPDDVTGISSYAFYNCANLTSITIPDSVTSIDGGAFSGCTNLININVDKDNTVYDSRNNCNAIIETETNTLVQGCKNTVIPDSVTSIGNYAFYGCTGLTSITIPDSVTIIGWGAFSGCTGLTSVNYTGTIGDWCRIEFSNYVSNPVYYSKCLYINGEEVSDLVIPNDVTKINSYAFHNCKNLTSVTIPNSVTSIGEYAFYGCDNLRNVLYSGSEEQWKNITIGSYNWSLTNSNKHYNISAEEAPTHCTLEAVEPTCTERGYTHMTCDCGYDVNYLYVNALGHNKASFIKTVAPTCTDDGYSLYHCDRCNEYFKDDYVDDLGGHGDLEFIRKVEPSCEYSGYSLYKCDRCGEYVEKDYVSSLGHNKDTFIKKVEPSCTYSGYSVYHCNRCDCDYKTDYVYGDDHSKDYVVKTVEPTCTESGYTVYHCNKCGLNFRSDYTWNGDHSKDSVVETVEPTCTKIGYTVYHCNKCGEDFEDDYTWNDDHSKDSVVETVAPTCTKDGYTIYHCDTCDGDFKDDYVWSDGHSKDRVVETVEPSCASCYTVYHCDTCGEDFKADYVRGNGHTKGEFVKKVEPTCTEYGYNVYRCSTCGEEFESGSYFSTGHSFVGDKCTGCGCAIMELTLNNPITITVENKETYYFKFVAKENGTYYFGTKGVGFSYLWCNVYDSNMNPIDFGHTWRDGMGKPLNNGYDFIAGKTYYIIASPRYFYEGKCNLSVWISDDIDYNPEIPDAPVENPALTDESTGIKIEYSTELNEGTELSVNEVADSSGFNLGNDVNAKIYDITLQKDGEKVQPSGDVTVKIPVPAGFDPKKISVVYIDDENNKTTIPCEVKDGYVIFKTDHFSYYAIVEQTGGVESVSISNVTMDYKSSKTLNPEIVAADGAEYTITYSSDSKNVTVDENGKIYAAKRGTANITVTVTDSQGNTVTDTCKVEVKYTWWQWLIKIVLFGWIWY